MRTKSDRDLVEYLSHAPNDMVHALLVFMDTFGQRKIGRLRKEITTAAEVPPGGTEARAVLVRMLVNSLRYFGSHSAAYVTRKFLSPEPGVSYHEVLDDVLAFVRKQARDRRSPSKLASVEDRERALCECLLELPFRERSDGEIAQLLAESGLSKKAAAHSATEVVRLLGGKTTFLLVVQSLGPKTVKGLIEKALAAGLTTYLGRQTAGTVVSALLAKVGQKAVTRFLGYVGLAFIAWDLVGLAGPARRVTVPCVALIAVERTLGRDAR